MNLRGAQRRFAPFRRRRPAGVALAVFAVFAVAGGGSALAGCGRPAGTVDVVSVDERLAIALADGRLVRLGGLDGPSPDRGAPELAKAARDALSGLAAGKRAELLLLAATPDRWGRTVADLALPEAGGGESSVASALLAEGYARVRPEFETRSCAAARLKLEDEARREGLGLWRDPAFAVLPAGDGRRLRQYDGQFVVVEGKVRRVGFGRSRLYLDLGSRGGATIVVDRRLGPILVRGGDSIDALVGRVIRARGALDGRFGPRIAVSDPAMIEIERRSGATGEEDPH